MLPEHRKHLVCPSCQIELLLQIDEEQEGRVKNGTLRCERCQRIYPIRSYIPRFLSGPTNYADGFGYQWNRHFDTQYDSKTGIPISEERFFKETRWPRQMSGEIILEAGCGSGRFTEHAVKTGAMVVSFDYSSAVEAAYKGNGHNANLLVVQASIFEMPFRQNYFNRVFCLGVIQHTPDPAGAFQSLEQVLRPGGQLVVDAYRRRPWYEMIFLTKYWVRPITRRLPPRLLYAFCNRWVRMLWPLTGFVVRLTGRRTLSWLFLVADYRGALPLPDHVQKEWSILDTFDMLQPAYDFPQTLASVRGWFESVGMRDVDVVYGYNGIEGRGTKRRIESGNDLQSSDLRS